MQTTLPPTPFSSWDDLRFFLTTAKKDSFSKAAKELRVTQSTISRRIESLEYQLGVRLFDRSPCGVVLTAEGEEVLEVARNIEGSILEIQRRVLGSDSRPEGLVRISLPEGLATFWITPRLRQFQEQHPGISLQLTCSVEPTDLRNAESDVSIRVRKPETPDLVAVKLGTVHFVPWASPAYLERFGTPKTPEDLRNHSLLDHEYYHFNERDCNLWLALANSTDSPRYWTNSSPGLLTAAQNGMGIALLPTYLCTNTKGIVPIDLGLRVHTCIWLTYHRAIKKVARIRAVIEWLKSLFDPRALPWFQDDFYPPEYPGPGRLPDDDQGKALTGIGRPQSLMPSPPVNGSASRVKL